MGLKADIVQGMIHQEVQQGTAPAPICSLANESGQIAHPSCVRRASRDVAWAQFK